MKPPLFEYLGPTSVDEALALLREHGEEAKVLAGGQSLVPLMNFRPVRLRPSLDLPQALAAADLVIEAITEDPEGKRAVYTTAAVSITHQRAAERVRQDEQELRGIIDAIPQTIVVLGPDGRNLYANQAVLAYTGLTLNEVMAA
jgi:PAS domain-containing protein